MNFEHRCFAEIDLDIIDQNLAQLKSLANGSKVLCVVKADAYGHGYKEVCQSLQSAGADFFGVSNIQEAIELRLAKVEKPILILGYTDPCNAVLLAKHNITQAVFSTDYAAALNAEAKKANVKVNIHIKLDTGMGRIGFSVLDKSPSTIAEIKAVCLLETLVPTGIFTHFAVADSITQKDIEYTDMQYKLFDFTIKSLESEGIYFEEKHCCNSAGMLVHPKWHLDMVRAGIILYGCPPSNEVACTLKPALQFKATISLVKQLKKGQSVSYGSTFTAQKDMLVATVSAGYADGYPRALSDKGIACVHNTPAPVLGRVCMDQLIIDVTDIKNVKQGDIVTLYGNAPADTVTEAANKTSTINYEILCHVSRRVPRVYTRSGKVVTVTDYQNN